MSKLGGAHAVIASLSDTDASVRQLCEDALVKRAAAFIKLRKFEEALDDAKEALRVNADSIGALYRKG